MIELEFRQTKHGGGRMNGTWRYNKEGGMAAVIWCPCGCSYALRRNEVDDEGNFTTTRCCNEPAKLNGYKR